MRAWCANAIDPIRGIKGKNYAMDNDQATNGDNVDVPDGGSRRDRGGLLDCGGGTRRGPNDQFLD